MIIKKINEKDYENFVKKSPLASFYQSVEWLKEKQAEGKTCQLVGLYKEDELKGTSLIIYLPILKKYQFAYASRGFIYDYKDIPAFKKALLNYFQDVVFVRIDPPLILAKYDKELNKEEDVDNYQVINTLKENGFLHFGFNMANEAMQFRFIHRIPLGETYAEQVNLFSKSTKKNMELALFKGVKIEKVNIDRLKEVVSFFDQTLARKNVKGFSLQFYEKLCQEFQGKVTMYLVYIDQDTYLANLDLKIKESEQKLQEVLAKMEHDHVGSKLTKAKELATQAIEKYKEEKKKALTLNKITYIASMLTITKYEEVVSLSSGMDNTYREFCPKYVMYPEMIKTAIEQKLKYVNFLGVKNIFDINDKDHGVYEVKRGFGGETIEYIGEFDLPIKPFIYKLYKLRNKLKK